MRISENHIRKIISSYYKMTENGDLNINPDKIRFIVSPDWTEGGTMYFEFDGCECEIENE